jgi:osmotically-inducible protein OsmY
MDSSRTARWPWLVVGLSLLGTGCNRQDTECLARIGQKAAARAGVLTGRFHDSLTSGWHGVAAAAEENGLEARVATRLRWEQSLADTKINVQVKDGAIELTGAVADLTKRRRAVAVAESTVGVDKVLDLLQIPEQKP